MPLEATLLLVLDLVGTFAFALNGALTALRAARLDIVGVVTLGMITALGGGTIRDVLLDSLPPATFVDWRYLAVAAGGGLIAFLFGRHLERLNTPITVLDAAGLSLFAVTGASKAIVLGFGPAQAVLVGGITAVGGGTLRDVMIRRIPFVLTSELYAIPAFIATADRHLVGRSAAGTGSGAVIGRPAAPPSLPRVGAERRADVAEDSERAERLCDDAGVDLEETLLPGVGVRYRMRTHAGELLGIVVRREGSAEIAVYDQRDPDRARSVLRLQPEEVDAVAEVLGVPRLTQRFADLSREVPGLESGRFPIGVGSRFADRPLGETRARTLTGCSIVAIVRGTDVVPSPGPADTLRPGDVLVAIGSARGLEQLERRLGEPA